MAKAQVRKDVGVGNEIVSMEKAQRGRLHRPARKQRGILKHDGQIGHDQLPHFATAGTVQHQAECALGAVVADENNGAVEKTSRSDRLRPRKQFAFENFFRPAHCWGQCASRRRRWQWGENRRRRRKEKRGDCFSAPSCF